MQDLRQAITQKIISNPERYSVQELQQAVQDGTVPSYVGIPLIQDKIQQAKQRQSMQTAQSAPPQQPPIAQQVMDEAQGLGGLSTNLPTKMASGGIIAFGDGGDVPRFTETGLVGTNPLVGNRLPGESFDAFKQRVLQADAQQRAAQQAQENQAREAQRQQLLEQRGASPFTNAFVTPTAITPTPPAQPAAAPATTGDQAPAAPAANPAAQPAGGISQLLSGLGLGGAGAPSGVPGLGIKAPKFAAPEGPSYEQTAKDYYGKYGEQASQLESDAETARAAARAKVTGKAFDEYKKSLQDEALQAGADKDEAKYMALFKAGLAIMGGGSQYALQNIGKGAMVGVEDYQSAIKDLKKAEKERQKELAHIEQARRAEDIGDRDAALKETEAALARKDSRLRYIGEGIYKASNLDRQQSFEVAKTQFGADADLARTNLAGQYTLAGHELSGKYGLAGHLLSAMAKPGMTQSQLMTHYAAADKQYGGLDTARQELAKAKGIKLPPPGASATFDRDAQALHKQRLDEIVGNWSGMSQAPAAGTGMTPELQALVAQYAGKK